VTPTDGSPMTSVKILGAGCSKCNILYQRLQDLKSDHDLDFELVKVTDIKEIISYGIMMTPGLVINGKVRSVGAVPKDSQLLEWLRDQTNDSQ
jgi:small redox-active disulfide protein 2